MPRACRPSGLARKIRWVIYHVVLGGGLVCGLTLFSPLDLYAQSPSSSHDASATSDSIQPRRALLRAARTKNANQLHSPESRPLKRFFLWVEENQLLRRLTGVGGRKVRLLPGGLGRGSGAALRLAYVPFPEWEALDVRLSAGGSVRGYWQFVGSVGYRSGPGFGHAFSQVQERPERTYLPFRTGADLPWTVDVRSWTSGGVLGLRPLSPLSIAASAAYLQNSPRIPTGLAVQDVSGILSPGTSTQYASIGGHITLDLRDVRYERNFGIRYVPTEDDLTTRPLNPDQGTLLSIEYTRFQEVSGVDASFNQFKLEAQQYVSVLNGYHTFAFRHRSTFTDADAGATVPFYRLPYVGGNFTLRGYDEFRFRRDPYGVLYNLEYRYKVWHHADMVLFADAGKVFGRLDQWGLTNLRYSYGAEVRFTTPRATLFRIGVAFNEAREPRLVFEFDNMF